MSQTEQLYRLQQIDNESRQAQARLKQIEDHLREPDELLAARHEAREIAGSLEEWRATQRDARNALQAVRDKVRTTEQRLYSGLVKNPKELTDLQLSVLALGRQRAGLEDEVLEAMVMVDDLGEAEQQATRRLAEVEASWQAARGELLREQGLLQARLSTLAAERETTLATIQPRLLDDYRQQARRQRNQVAVAGLMGNRCQVCGVVISATTVRAAQLGEQAYCDSCGRILHPL